MGGQARTRRFGAASAGFALPAPSPLGDSPVFLPGGPGRIFEVAGGLEEISRGVGYDDDTIRRVQELNLKKNLGKDPEVQVLEDALCLVFLEHQFAQLAAGHSEEKMIGILQKTWKKMSPQTREVALSLSFAPREQQLLQKALGD
jgi:hypothetical protein